ncbi:fluoride efflux transporter CrcB [Salidesulfovibrio onnuriiensis]|uniref:fluoride efflux transporter CrcB n=1 Tax=Salidesulfovibrio onnuriiensis TaxID=2583823 RepID=UPI0011C87EA8|nr:fluoride efflux transporter CrcB [Salidesulfovibrio onnuriiensis]
MLKKILLLSAGGACGTLCRYWLSGVAQRLAGTNFPAGTFAVNMLGCFLFGTVWGYMENRIGLGGDLRLLLLSGFMGAFTTFSTYMFETANLVKLSQYLQATLNIAGQSVAGLILVLLGIALGRML